MALRSRITSEKDGSKHSMSYQVASKEPEGSTADVEITWETAGLGMPIDISPAGAVQSAGKLSWPGKHIPETGTAFHVTLHCADSGQHTVTGIAKEHGGDDDSHAVEVDC